MKHFEQEDRLFNLNFDPYECLGVSKNCSDFDLIKNAYKKKSFYLNPEKTNGVTKYEFSNLNKSYLFIKMQADRTATIRHNPDSYQDRSHPQLNLDAKLANELRQRKIDLTKPSNGPPRNSLLSSENFDPEKAFQEMMHFRPTSARYNPNIETNTQRVQIGENYLKNVNGWGGNDNISAPIVSDENIMYIRNHEIDSFAEVDSGPFERNMPTSNTKIDKNEINSFMRLYHNLEKTPKVSLGVFKSQMDEMENSFNQKLSLEAEETRNFINNLKR